MDLSNIEIHIEFPNLQLKGYKNTSPATINYNCIAWAAGDNTRWWWPDRNYQYYWPQEITREVSIGAFIELFETLGYVCCEDESLEKNFEKIVIYTNFQKIVTHAARQLESGKWTSKIGKNKDIEHTLDGLNSFAYGSVEQVMKRQRINN